MAKICDFAKLAKKYCSLPNGGGGEFLTRAYNNCLNLDYQTAIKAHIQKLYQVSVILISLDSRIVRIINTLFQHILQKNQQNHVSPLIRKIMVLTMVQTIILTISCGDEFPERNFEELAKGYNYKYCIFKDDEMCIEGLFAFCPRGGTLGNRCPYAEGSGELESFGYCVFRDEGICFAGPFKACPDGGDLSNSCGDREYGYCVFAEDRMCLEGAYLLCPSGGMLSNSCPYADFFSSGNVTYGYCIFAEDGICLEGSHSICPSGGKLGDICPYDLPSSSSEETPSSSSTEANDNPSSSSFSSSSSAGEISSSSVPICGEKEYDPATESCCNNSIKYPKELNATCINGIVWTPCGAGVYDISRSFCLEGTSYPLCDGDEYDPADKFCYRDIAAGEELKDRCGGKTYEPPEFCLDGILFVFCGTTPYNTNTHFCSDGNAVATINQSSSSSIEQSSSSSVPVCGENAYDPAAENCCGNSVKYPKELNATCINGIVWAPCGAGVYDISRSFCEGGKSYPLCNGETYDTENKFCYKDLAAGDGLKDMCDGKIYEPPEFCLSNALYGFCAAKPYNTGTYFCLNGMKIEELCGSREYDPSTEFCHNGNVAVKPVKIGSISFAGFDYNGVYYRNSTPTVSNSVTISNATAANCDAVTHTPVSTAEAGTIKVYASSTCNGTEYKWDSAFATVVPDPTASGACRWQNAIITTDKMAVIASEQAMPTGYDMQNNYGRCERAFSANGAEWDGAIPAWQADAARIVNIRAEVLCGGDLLTQSQCPDIKIKSPKVPNSGYFIDDRDGQIYPSVVIEGQTWMAENLNWAGAGICRDDIYDNCLKYGRLYYLAEDICPSGWHIPTNDEWYTLRTNSSMSDAGKRLKAENGWNDDGNGTDEFGFSALPGACTRTGLASSASCYDIIFGNSGHWWASTYCNSDRAYYSIMSKSSDNITIDCGLSNYLAWTGNLLSVRCIKN
ncbi:MAG: hypothetical protein LBB36_02745 [Fibromonadaceae bacterium]|nr:hypothetical protein [Fibromonadaceae bacterium]